MPFSGSHGSRLSGLPAVGRLSISPRSWASRMARSTAVSQWWRVGRLIGRSGVGWRGADMSGEDFYRIRPTVRACTFEDTHADGARPGRSGDSLEARPRDGRSGRGAGGQLAWAGGRLAAGAARAAGLGGGLHDCLLTGPSPSAGPRSE